MRSPTHSSVSTLILTAFDSSRVRRYDAHETLILFFHDVEIHFAGHLDLGPHCSHVQSHPDRPHRVEIWTPGRRCADGLSNDDEGQVQNLNCLAVL